MIERGIFFLEKDLTKYKISQISELTFLMASMIRSSVPPCQVRACQASVDGPVWNKQLDININIDSKNKGTENKLKGYFKSYPFTWTRLVLGHINLPLNEIERRHFISQVSKLL